MERSERISALMPGHRGHWLCWLPGDADSQSALLPCAPSSRVAFCWLSTSKKIFLGWKESVRAVASALLYIFIFNTLILLRNLKRLYIKGSEILSC